MEVFFVAIEEVSIENLKNNLKIIFDL